MHCALLGIACLAACSNQEIKPTRQAASAAPSVSARPGIAGKPSQAPAVEPRSLPSAYHPGIRYTSVILDVRGLGFRASMSPSIESGGRQLFPVSDQIDSRRLIDTGIAAFVYGDDHKARHNDRAGAHPLLLRPLAVTGRLQAGVQLSPADAGHLRAADARGNFLRDFRVIFLIEKAS